MRPQVGRDNVHVTPIARGVGSVSVGTPWLCQQRLIAWREIWDTLYMAEVRGSKDIATTFMQALIRDALFDDRGAWSVV